MHEYGFAPIFYSAAPWVAIALPVLIAAAIWTLILKGFALWYAARGGQKGWFIVLLVINTLGIIEIVYLIWFRPTSFELEKEGNRPAGASSAGA